MRFLLRASLLALLAVPASLSFAQYSIPGSGSGGASSSVSLTQGGNTAVVDASGRLSVGLNAVGGTSLSLGQTTMSASLPVTFASNQSTLNVAVTSPLPTGSNALGSITNTSFGISGSLPTGANTIGSIANTAFGVTGALPAGSNVIGKVVSVPTSSCAGNTVKDTGAVTLTATAAAPTAMNATTCVLRLFFTNTDTSTSHTVTLTDGSGSPNTYIPAFTLAKQSTYVVDLGGMALNGGLKWNADAATFVVAQAIGLQ